MLVAAYNEERVIARKLDNCLGLEYPIDRMQILVAADGSDDNTVEIVRSYSQQNVEVSYIPERDGKMAAINRAMPRSRGEIVVFSDANNMYDLQAIRQLVAPFADPRVGGVTGSKTIIEDGGSLSESEGLYWKYESFIKEQETRLGTCTAAVGEIFAIRRELFLPPPSNTINDDFYMASDLIRRGYILVYNPKAYSYETVSSSAQDEIVRRTRMIAGRYQAMSLAFKIMPWKRPLVVWQVVSHKFLRPLVPFFMIGALLTNISLAVWPPVAPGNSSIGALILLASPHNWGFLLLQVLFYGLAFLGIHQPIRGPMRKILYLPAFLVNSNLAALIGFYRYISGKRDHIWQRVNRNEPQ
jgi:cellulose synthase/poly-beta-1,6-N-acetylglucosamine synthase-like glycosyltransferase